MLKIDKKDMNIINDKLKEGYYLRISLVKSGCTGFEYQFLKDENYNELKDVIIENKIIFFKTLLPKLENSTLYYKKEGLNKILDLKNPNISVQCGCGQSFSF
jgi:iron-sulfur cluster assembly protein